jgi:hypothetical protein
LIRSFFGGGGLVLAFGVPVGFVAKLAQDQVESHTGYRLRIDGGTKLSSGCLRATLGKITLVDGSGGKSATSTRWRACGYALASSLIPAGRGSPRWRS